MDLIVTYKLILSTNQLTRIPIKKKENLYHKCARKVVRSHSKYCDSGQKAASSHDLAISPPNSPLATPLSRVVLGSRKLCRHPRAGHGEEPWVRGTRIPAAHGPLTVDPGGRGSLLRGCRASRPQSTAQTPLMSRCA